MKRGREPIEHQTSKTSASSNCGGLGGKESLPAIAVAFQLQKTTVGTKQIERLGFGELGGLHAQIHHCGRSFQDDVLDERTASHRKCSQRLQSEALTAQLENGLLHGLGTVETDQGTAVLGHRNHELDTGQIQRGESLAQCVGHLALVCHRPVGGEGSQHLERSKRRIDGVRQPDCVEWRCKMFCSVYLGKIADCRTAVRAYSIKDRAS
mmetsp:Transcript_49616/g.124752  ORF Transcript_49616/g.124752 Transcript_49616/m.124752 type:complete len:209 (-) Transcript_49616:179-805(-)